MQSPVTLALLAANVAIFLYEYVYLSKGHQFFFEYRYALSLNGLRMGRYWQLLTYQFLHGGFLHIFFNCWAIYIFGQVIEMALGKWRMLTVYFLSGIAGGLLQMLAARIWPDFFDAPIVGASAGAFGLVTAFAVLFPTQRLLMLLFFIIPVAMRARTVLIVSVAFAVFGIAYPWLHERFHFHLPPAFGLDQLFENVGHAAHLGGIIAGFLLTLWLKRTPQMRRFYALDPKTTLNINPAPD